MAAQRTNIDVSGAVYRVNTPAFRCIVLPHVFAAASASTG